MLAAGEMRLKIYRTGKVALVRFLARAGANGARRVVDEHPYKVTDALAREYWLHDLGLQFSDRYVDIAHIRDAV
jgi:NAD-specific glutamate dehydrogenase